MNPPRPPRRAARWLLGSLAALLVLLLGVLNAQGGGTRAGWFSTAFQALNLESVPATFEARFLRLDGTPAYTFTDTLPPGAARFYEPSGLDPAFTGTLALRSPNQVALEVLHLSSAITGENTILEGVFEETISSHAFVPIDFCTLLKVHSIAPTQTAILQVTARFTDGKPAGQRQFYIPPEATASLNPILDLLLPLDFAGSAVLQASGPIEVNVWRRCQGRTSFMAPTDAATFQLVPQVSSFVRGTITPTLMIQNVNPVSVTGQVVFAAGTVVDFAVPPNGLAYVRPPATRFFIYLPLVVRDGAPLRAPLPAAPARHATPLGTDNPAVIYSSAPVAASVQVRSRIPGQRGTYAYPAFVPARATNAVALPLLFDGYNGWVTEDRIWVRNAGSRPAEVTIRYVAVPTGELFWQTLPLPPGQGARATLPDLPTALGAAILVADQPIVALAGAFNPELGLVENGELRYRGLNFNFACREVISGTFSWLPPTPTVGLPVSFTPEISGSEPISITWDFGDGASGAEPVHTYSAAGTYTVTMAASNCLGFGRCSTSRTIVIWPTRQIADGVLSSLGRSQIRRR